MSLNERLLLHGSVIRYLDNLSALRKLTPTCWDFLKNFKEVMRVRKLVKTDFDMLLGVSVRDMIQSDVLSDIRGSRMDSYTAAVTVVSYLVKRGVNCGVATINAGADAGSWLSVQDEFTKSSLVCSSNTVVVLGDLVIDVLHSDRLIRLDEYIESLDNVDISFAIENAKSCMATANIY